MKDLNISQMENLVGGSDSCRTAGTIGGIFAVVGLGLTFAGLLISTGGIAAVLVASQGIAFGVAGGGVGLGTLIGC